MENMVYIGRGKDILKVTSKAVKMMIGTTKDGHPMYTWYPKSVLYIDNHEGMHVPDWCYRRRLCFIELGYDIDYDNFRPAFPMSEDDYPNMDFMDY